MAGTVGMRMTVGGNIGADGEGLPESDLVLLWGTNTLTANPHLWPFILEARKKGAKIVVIDPIRTRTAKQADWHVQIRPGTDGALALGMMNVIIGEDLVDHDYVDKYTNGFDELSALAAKYPPERVEVLTGLDRNGIVALAREYATTRPAAIRLNYGVQRSERGGNAMRAMPRRFW